MRKKLHCFAALTLAVCMIFVLTPAGLVYGSEPEINKGNIIIHNSYEDFVKGICADTAVNEKGNGVIELKKGGMGYPSRGTYTSPEILTEPFEYMVMSWNTDTPGGTSVKIEAQVSVNGTWSKWLLIGTWSTGGDKASAMSQSQARDNIAYVNTDIVSVLGSDGETADKFRYRLTLYTEDDSLTPSVRLISAALRNTLPGQSFEKSEDTTYTQAEIDAFRGTLDVKPYSQIVRDPQFSNIICSAVSSAMVLDYKGVNILPEMAAMGVLDTFYDGYGNWPFNAAFIASYGFESYIAYCTGIDDIKRELMAGNPVICSVRYKQSSSVSGDLPVISAAPISLTYGHLIVVVGYEVDDDGKSYVVVNDPAAGRDDAVNIRYLESQFLSAWKISGMIAYKTHEIVPEGGQSAPVISDAVLVPTGRSRKSGNYTFFEHILFSEDENNERTLVSAAKALNPHNPTFETGVSIVVWDDAKDKVHSYGTPSRDAVVWLRESQMDKTVYIFLKTGGYYKAAVEK